MATAPPHDVLEDAEAEAREAARHEPGDTMHIETDAHAQEGRPNPEVTAASRNGSASKVPSLRQFLKSVVQVGGSDLHLQADSTPVIRVDGRLRFLDCGQPDNEMMVGFVKELAGDDEKFQEFLDKGSC
ncbi:MAG: hypothetical protein AAGI46_08835, partial [Planctomycetota bacterium]